MLARGEMPQSSALGFRFWVFVFGGVAPLVCFGAALLGCSSYYDPKTRSMRENPLAGTAKEAKGVC
jgi:hypothetical protein